jgi:hypothetical protein
MELATELIMDGVAPISISLSTNSTTISIGDSRVVADRSLAEACWCGVKAPI